MLPKSVSLCPDQEYYGHYFIILYYYMIKIPKYKLASDCEPTFNHLVNTKLYPHLKLGFGLIYGRHLLSTHFLASFIFSISLPLCAIFWVTSDRSASLHSLFNWVYTATLCIH